MYINHTPHSQWCIKNVCIILLVKVQIYLQALVYILCIYHFKLNAMIYVETGVDTMYHSSVYLGFKWLVHNAYISFDVYKMYRSFLLQMLHPWCIHIVYPESSDVYIMCLFTSMEYRSDTFDILWCNLEGQHLLRVLWKMWEMFAELIRKF